MSQEAVRPMTADERAKREGSIVCKALFTILSDLDLKSSDMEKILDVSRKTIGRWSDADTVTFKNENSLTKQAASHLIGAYRSLATIFSNSKDRQAWIKTEHPELRQAPIDLMRNSMEGLIKVRRYLEAAQNKGA